MVIFLLLGVSIAMLNELNQFALVLLLKGANYLTIFTADQLGALAPCFLICTNWGLALLVAVVWYNSCSLLLQAWPPEGRESLRLDNS